ncbi:MAG TPA: OmpH family outer membrane protein [Desulfuromonadaceae bacterium]
MNSLCKKLLISLCVCILPSMTLAAENPPAKAAPQAPPATPQKAPVPSAPQPPAAAATPAKAAEPLRIGYVDLIRVGSESEPGKEGKDRLTERQKKLQSQIEAKRKQLDKQRAAIEAKLSSLSPKQREAKSKEFGKKVEEFQKFGRNAEEQLQELQQELSRTLYEKVEQAADDYGKASGFTAIIVKRQLLYAANGVDVKDVTDQIIKLVNGKEHKK